MGRSVRYFLDRIDVSVPAAPVLLVPVNIPGQVVHFDHQRGLVVTVDDVSEVLEGVTTSVDCYDGRSNTQFQYDQAALEASNYDYENVPGVCTHWNRQLSSLVLDGNVARRVSLLELGTDTRMVGPIAVSDSRIFYQTYAYAADDSGRIETDLTALAYGADGQLLVLGNVGPESDDGYYSYNIAARGNQAFVSSYSTLEVIASPNEGPLTSTIHELRGSYCDVTALEVVGDAAFCAEGLFGVERIAL